MLDKKTLKALLLTVITAMVQPAIHGQTNYEPIRYDIVISEIMAKPTPEIGLPGVEYIELHSRLPYPVNLRNWQLKLGNTTKSLPDISLDSCGYAVLIAQKNEDDFASVCEHIVGLSSLSVTDGGQSLTLYNNVGEVIHYVNFKKNWHTEEIKQEGGWSLEMIDENWPCAGSWNWDSSTDPSGGTPGRANSIRNSLYDNNPPSIVGVTMPESKTLRIHFSKTMAIEEKPALETAFRTSPTLNIGEITEVPPDFQSVDIHFQTQPQPGTHYQLYVSGTFADCGGNRFHIEDEVSFGISSQPEYNNVIINEILTNPKDGENADYVEIYNNSDKIIDLKEIKIGYGGDTMPKKSVTAVSKGMQLFPNEYAVLCRQREITLQQYICKDEKRLFACDSLFDFAASQGIIYLTDKSLQAIDRLEYRETMHYPKLLTTKGVALERIHAEHPTQDDNNWRSAAESAGFGTPGYRNSQAGCEETTADFAVIPDVFSPDNDGFEDYSEVTCHFSEEANRVTIILYNNRGHPVKHLANNVLCGSSASFRWDGDDDRGQSAPAGMYIVQIESWNLQTQKTLRKRKAVSIYR